MIHRKNQRTAAVLTLISVYLSSSQLTMSASWADGGGTTTPPSNPAPIDTAQAQQDGTIDGTPDGAREGTERGQVEGNQNGITQGYNTGLRECHDSLSKKAYLDGYNRGSQVGMTEGNNAGYNQGQIDGARDGQTNGQRDGETRADNDSRAASAGPGLQLGTNQANASDATQRGTVDGTAAGDAAAHQQANTYDYALGRKQYNDARYAEAVANQDAFSQKGIAANSLRALLNRSSVRSAAGLHALGAVSHVGSDLHALTTANPDFRYSNPRRTYPSAAETTAYQKAYHDGYVGGFSHTYGLAYDQANQQSYSPNYSRGCQDANRQDYSADSQRGYNDGYHQAYQQAYDREYPTSHDGAYNRVFPQASTSAYQANYQADYDRHFEEARASAYAQRVNQLYSAAFDSAKSAKYNAVYPGYAAAANARGQADEAADFTARPVRLLNSAIQETIANGVTEPGEELRIRLQLRNFSDAQLAGQDVKVTIEALNGASVILSQSTATLVKGLKNKSVTVVSDALSFMFDEKTLDQTVQFKLTVSYRGVVAGTQTLSATNQYLIATEYAETPILSEGVSMPVKLKVTNRGNVATDSGLTVHLDGSFKVSIPQPDESAGALVPGESKVIEFGVIATDTLLSHHYPLTFTAKTGAGRKVGLFDRNDEIEVRNDYKVSINGYTPRGLEKAGVTSVPFTLENDSTVDGSNIQVSIRFPDDTTGNFTVVGNNPLVIPSLKKGKTVNFEVPIRAAADSSALGMFEIQVKVNGVAVITRSLPY